MVIPAFPGLNNPSYLIIVKPTVVFEEGAQATWLYDLIHPLVAEVVVCNPRVNNEE
ncbi:MAG: hypothetical protein ACREOW_10370 [Thermodesulfobacteriota bacterium]